MLTTADGGNILCDVNTMKYYRFMIAAKALLLHCKWSTGNIKLELLSMLTEKIMLLQQSR